MNTEIVEAVKESQWMKDGVEATTYWVTLVDGVGQREVPCYDPRGKDLKEDAPLPEGWEVKTSKAGKLYLAAPKAVNVRGNVRPAPGTPFSTAWRNTEAGAKYEQEMMNARTAVMQARREDNGKPDLDNAATIYQFLRESVSAPRTEASAPAVSGATGAPTERVGADTPSDGAAPTGKGPAPSDTTCQHEWTDAPRKGWKLCIKCRRAVPEGEAK